MKKNIKKPKKTELQNPTELSETFFLTFIGEFVEVAGSFLHDNSEVPIILQGYILDTDKDYYFLGETSEEITSAIKKENVKYIKIINEEDPLKEALTQWEVPTEEKFKN